MEPSTAHDACGPKYYCGKGFEKPRIPPGEAAIIEDERRKDLWRLFLPRNSPYLNGYMALVILYLCANMDAQVVVTAKGAADYVAKYISKYGAGQSVNARIASLIDDIITRLPEEKKSTIASVMSKAFIATAVPDTLCGLEAWHLLLGLNRTVCSRGFIALQGDGEKAHRSVIIPKKPVQPDAVVASDAAGDEDAGPAEVLETTLVRKTPAERYCERFRGKLSPYLALVQKRFGDSLLSPSPIPFPTHPHTHLHPTQNQKPFKHILSHPIPIPISPFPLHPTPSAQRNAKSIVIRLLSCSQDVPRAQKVVRG
jgi:hypothetical protein